MTTFDKYPPPPRFGETYAGLKTIIEAVPIGIIVFDETEEVVYANDLAERLFAKRLKPDGPTIRCGDFIDCGNRHRDPRGCGYSPDCPTCPLLRAIRSALAAEALNPVQTGEAPIARDPGFEPMWVKYRVRPVQLDTERIAVMAIDDLTEQKQAEAEAEKLRAHLAQSQKIESVGRLAGGVAHEFNNKLMIILGYIELVMNQIDLASPLQEDLSAIQDAALKSVDLVKKLLAFAQKQTVLPEVLDLNRKISGIMSMLEYLIGERIVLIWKPSADLWRIQIDPSQIDQLLINLALNSRDAIAGTGTLTIGTQNIHKQNLSAEGGENAVPGDYVQLLVRDDGCGMTPEIRHTLFEPFFTTKPVGQGTGLGLSAVYGIVSQNRGFIRVESSPAQGATFRIYLPRAEGTGKSTRDYTAPVRTSIPERGKTILLVEDDQSLLGLVKTILERHEYSVISAANSRKALKLVKEDPDPIHLLLTDIFMPDMDGLTLVKHVTALRPEIKVLYMSAYPPDTRSLTQRKDPALGYLRKPFAIDDLVTKVRTLLDT